MLMQLSNSVRMDQSSQVQKKQRRNHIEDLAVLPVFFNLQDKKAIVVGDSHGAAWKAELLVASGAHVHVYSTDPEPEMQDLLCSRHARQSRIIWHCEPWTAASFQGASVAIGDIDEEAEVRRFCFTARSVGAAVNVIDQPKFCQFQFGSIVNRSPLVVGISTSGAAPVLGQGVRRRIEALLPRSLQDWAQLAQTVRSRVNDQLVPGPDRRKFWEQFVDHAFSGTHKPHGDVTTLIEDAKAKPELQGKLSLVESGTGKADLLTLRAVRMLQAADVIHYDECVPDEILELARREAKFVPFQSMNEGKIADQDMLEAAIKPALAGKHVVMLTPAFGLDHQAIKSMLSELKQRGVNCNAVLANSHSLGI